MPTITDRVVVHVDITPHQLGVIFARMHSREQADFFEGVADETRTWAKAACFQWQHLYEDLQKVPRGLRAFQEMAEYARPPE